MKYEIRNYIRQIVGDDLQNTEVCRVVSVDSTTCSVTTVTGEIEYTGVRLKAHIEDDRGIIIKPKVGSYVLVLSTAFFKKICIKCCLKFICKEGLRTWKLQPDRTGYR